MTMHVDTTSLRTLPDVAIERLIEHLRGRGHRVIAPTFVDGVVTVGEIHSTAELARGVRAVTGPGEYHTEPSDGWFDAVGGPDSPKRWLHPPEARVMSGTLNAEGVTTAAPDNPAPVAFLGIRPCDLAALGILDVPLAGGAHVNHAYRQMRAGTVTVVIDCTRPAATCFCSSMDAGPFAETGFDIALTEITGETHRFIARAGSGTGADILAEIGTEIRGDEGVVMREARTAALSAISRRFDRSRTRAVLRSALRSERWDEFERRCLACANCTQVCPTCFCSSFADSISLDGACFTRTRRWDSCFSPEFSYIHGGAVRASIAARYRQWFTHKLSTWTDQFDTAGCVGCGRCITWCPAGIDITAEAQIFCEVTT